MTIKEILSDKFDIYIKNIVAEKESLDYNACTFEARGKKIIFRQSRGTPAKTGQFVTIWKRNADGLTVPIDLSDDFDLIMILSKTDLNYGLFIFPKQLLTEKVIINSNGKNGKRGIRVYPAWDKANNNQATKTQLWQCRYFIDATDEKKVDVAAIQRLLS